ncbi:MAG: hypothetical protein WEA09_10240 [Gemmatimonadota bacterium]
MTLRVGVWVTVSILAVLHFLLHIGIGAGRWAPDLLTVALLLGVREVRMGPAATLGLAFGLLEDVFSLLSFGANAVAMAVVGAVGSRTRDFFVGDSLLFLLCYLGMGKWFRDTLHWLAEGEGVRGNAFQILVLDGVPQAGYVAVIGVAAFLVSGAWRETIR